MCVNLPMYIYFKVDFRDFYSGRSLRSNLYIRAHSFLSSVRFGLLMSTVINLYSLNTDLLLATRVDWRQPLADPGLTVVLDKTNSLDCRQWESE